MSKYKCCALKRAQFIDHSRWREENWMRLGSVYPEIPAEGLEEYVREVFRAPGITYTSRGYANMDGMRKYVTVFDGMRHTTGDATPFDDPGSHSRPRVFIFGDSRVYGLGVEDRDTLPSRLQMLFDCACRPVRVLNCGIRGNTLMNILSRIRSMDFAGDDILVLFMPLYAHRFPERDIKTRYLYYGFLKRIIEEAAQRGIRLLVFKYPDIRRLKKPTDLERYFQHTVRIAKRYCCIIPEFSYSPEQQADFIDTQDALAEIAPGTSSFWDYNHTGPEANAAIARFIFPHVCRALDSARAKPWKMLPLAAGQREEVDRQLEAFQKDCRDKFSEQVVAASQRTLQRYREFEKFQCRPGESIGAIIANCNPFSNGHTHLVEEALKHVDYLYFFILSEDRSVFTFEHRLAMAREYYADNPRIRVLPSENLMGSTLTFPDYFDRDYLSVKAADFSLDTTYFKDIIAKIFNISVRFLGTEPNSPFMSHYNASLKRQLPESGIQVVEIERNQDPAGRPVSASKIRECISNNDLGALEGLVPYTTLKIIRDFYCAKAR